jgi:hypothetical protein
MRYFVSNFNLEQLFQIKVAGLVLNEVNSNVVICEVICGEQAPLSRLSNNLSAVLFPAPMRVTIRTHAMS